MSIGAFERKLIAEHFENDENVFRTGLLNKKNFRIYEMMKERDEETKKKSAAIAAMWDKFLSETVETGDSDS